MLDDGHKPLSTSAKPNSELVSSRMHLEEFWLRLRDDRHVGVSYTIISSQPRRI